MAGEKQLTRTAQTVTWRAHLRKATHDPFFYGVLYVTVSALLLLTVTSIDRFGARIHIFGEILEFPQWVALFTVVPIAMLILIAVLATLDWNQSGRGPAAIAFPAIGLALTLVASMIVATSIGLIFDGEWATRTPDAIASRTRAAGWLHRSFVFAALVYFAHSTISAVMSHYGAYRPKSPLIHWLFGALPALAISAFALILYREG